MLNKNILVLLLLIFSLAANADVLYTSDENIYNLNLDKNNDLEAQIHDYINNISYSCGIEPLDQQYWRSGSFTLPNKGGKLDKSCQSMKEKIEFICYNNGLLLNDHKRPRGFPSFYPVTSEEMARSGTEFRGFVKCFFNKEFEKNNISTEIYVEYKLDKITEFHKMADPRERSKKVKIVQSAKLLPNIKEMKPRYEIVIID
jgi:hypothetical protein